MYDSEKQPGVKLTRKNTDIKHWMGSNWPSGNRRVKHHQSFIHPGGLPGLLTHGDVHAFIHASGPLRERVSGLWEEAGGPALTRGEQAHPTQKGQPAGQSVNVCSFMIINIALKYIRLFWVGSHIHVCRAVARIFRNTEVVTFLGTTPSTSSTLDSPPTESHISFHRLIFRNIVSISFYPAPNVSSDLFLPCEVRLRILNTFSLSSFSCCETAVELGVWCFRVHWSGRSSLVNASLQMSEGEPIQMRSKFKVTLVTALCIYFVSIFCFLCIFSILVLVFSIVFVFLILSFFINALMCTRCCDPEISPTVGQIKDYLILSYLMSHPSLWWWCLKSGYMYSNLVVKD